MTKTSRLKVLKRIFYVFAGGLFLLFVAAYILLNFWEPIISKNIKDSFYKSTNQLYKIEFDDIAFNVFIGKFSLKNIKLIPDIEVYKKLKADKKQPAYLFNLSIERAFISKVNLISLYNDKILHISEISVRNPSVTVINDLSYKKTNEDTSIFRNPYDLIKKQLSGLVVDQINLKNINLDFISDSLGRRKSKKVFLSYFKVRNLQIDSLSQTDSLRPFYSDDIKLSIKNFTHPFKDSVNKMSFEEVVASTGTQSIQVYNFKITPKFSEDKFKDIQGFRKTRIELYVKEANIHDVDFKKLFFEQRLYGNRIDINNMQADIFLNNLAPKNPKKKVRFPAELVYDIKIPFHFNTVKINKSNINYAEFYSLNKYRWGLKFSDLDGTITNFSNDTLKLRKDQFVNIKLNCNFNGKAKSSFEFIFDYLSPLKPYYVKGAITNYNLDDLNSITTNLIHMQVANCNLRVIKFVMNGDKKSMSNNIVMMYNNLRVKILEFDKDEKKYKKHGLLTLLANHMVLEDQNPRKNGNLTKSRFDIRRNEDWSFFSFIWKGLLKGIKESVGIDQKMEKELRFQADRYSDFKSFTKGLKENSKLRKEKRKQRRIERSQDKLNSSSKSNIDSNNTSNNFGL